MDELAGAAAGAAAGQGAGPGAGAGAGPDALPVAQVFVDQFTAAMDDNLNMSKALGHLFDFMREINRAEPRGAGAVAAAERIMLEDTQDGARWYRK